MSIAEHIHDIIQRFSRPVSIEAPDGTRIYTDMQKCYQLVEPVAFNRTVSNGESLREYVIEVARRKGNITGDKMTMVFNQGGGICYLADGQTKDVINYNRELSPEWKFLSDATHCNRVFTHAELLRTLQKLKPFFIPADYQKIALNYRAITFDEKVTVTSQPQPLSGKAGHGISVEFKRGSDGGDTAELISEFNLRVTYARGGQRVYDAAIEIDAGMKDGKIFFNLLWPEKENTVNEAVQDELTDFTAAVKPVLPQLLCVVDY